MEKTLFKNVNNEVSTKQACKIDHIGPKFVHHSDKFDKLSLELRKNLQRRKAKQQNIEDTKQKLSSEPELSEGYNEGN